MRDGYPRPTFSVLLGGNDIPSTTTQRRCRIRGLHHQGAPQRQAGILSPASAPHRGQPSGQQCAFERARPGAQDRELDDVVRSIAAVARAIAEFAHQTQTGTARFSLGQAPGQCGRLGSERTEWRAVVRKTYRHGFGIEHDVDFDAMRRAAPPAWAWAWAWAWATILLTSSVRHRSSRNSVSWDSRSSWARARSHALAASTASASLARTRRRTARRRQPFSSAASARSTVAKVGMS